jgi:threonine dehydrogenase-like Zn-dependent dehydrogenase
LRGLLVERGRVAYREDLPRPAPRPGETRVRVLCAGVCATDLALVRGYMDFAGVPGHEFCGVALDGPLAGRRVVGEINAACGDCGECRAGRRRHCERRTVLGILGRSGAFAEELALPSANLHAVPDAVSTDAATFCEPLAAAFRIVEDVELAPGMRALVAGDGRLGLLCARVLVLSGLDVTVTGRHPERAALVLGARYEEGLLDGAPRQKFDLAVDATGDPAALPRVLGRVRPCGTLVLKTTTERPTTLDLAPLVVDEIRLVGSRCGPFEPALDALAQGRIDVESLVCERYALDEGERALERAARAGTLKVLIEVEP